MSRPAIPPKRTAEQLISAGGTTSVQVLNEIANVTRPKMGMLWTETRAFFVHDTWSGASGGSRD
jgi:hypothetical protein